METIVTALAAQQAELSALVSPVDAAAWALPSRCEGWTIADVMLHLAQTNEMAIASANGDFAASLETLAGGISTERTERAVGTVEDGAGLLVDEERGASATVVHDRWQASVAGLDAALRAGDPHRRVMWVAGELSARTLATTRLTETWIHTGDVAFGLGVDVAPTDRLWHVARLAWRTLPYAFEGAGRTLTGPVAFELVGPGGEAWDFRPDDAPTTVIRGAGADLCLVAARRADPAHVDLRGEGPDAAAVLELVRTFA
ncbi:MAG TPA: maleylpyruvate isomerase family mycothiol-dependent enzyme [Acidimicrobiales bacterium]